MKERRHAGVRIGHPDLCVGLRIGRHGGVFGGAGLHDRFMHLVEAATQRPRQGRRSRRGRKEATTATEAAGTQS